MPFTFLQKVEFKKSASQKLQEESKQLKKHNDNCKYCVAVQKGRQNLGNKYLKKS